MALSTRRTNMIIADWKTGKFSSYYAISKHHKISQPKAKEILVNIPQSNTDIVEAGVAYEKAKNISNNLVEQKAIEIAVKERTISDQIEDVVFEATLSNVKAIKEEVREDNKELTLYDRKTGQEGLDKALVTAGKAQRFANSQVTVNTQNNLTQENNLSIEWE